MNPALSAPLGEHAVPIVAVLTALAWLLFVAGGRRRWLRRAAIAVYLLALALALAAILRWLIGLFR